MTRSFWNRLSTPIRAMAPPALHAPDSPAVFWLNRILRFFLTGSVFLIPVLFSGWTLDSIELPKQTIFIFFIGIALCAWVLRSIVSRRFSISRNWIHVAIGLFALVYLLLSLSSQNRYLSFAGNLGESAWSFSFVFACLIFFFLLANEVRTTKQVYDYVFIFLGSSLLAGLYGFFQMLGLYLLPWGFAHSNNFTSMGSVYSLATFMVVPLIIASAIAFHGCRDEVCLLGTKTVAGKLARGLVWALMVVAFIDLIFVDFWLPWAILLFGALALVLARYARSRTFGHPAKLALPAIFVVIGFGLLIFKTPLNFNLPAEVAPSFSASWSIAKQTLAAHPLLGTGPGTWIFDWSAYRSGAVNQSPFWAVRFDRGFSTFLTLLATTGILGILCWILLLIAVAWKSTAHLLHERSDDLWYATVMVFAGWLALVLLSFLYNFNVAHQFAFWFLTALLGGVATREMMTFETRRSSLKRTILLSLGSLVCLGAVLVLWLNIQRYAAETVFSKGVALFRAGRPLEEVIPQLEKAMAWNGLDDMYARNLSQAYLLHALSALQSHPSDDRFKPIQTEVSSALDLAKNAALLAPSNVDNWINLGIEYYNISNFTRGADEAALANYTEALKREPMNPALYDQIGQIYLLRADAYRTQLDSKDAAKASAKQHMADNLSQAADYLHRAIALKSDYLPAHYHLASVFERQGQNRPAIQELEGVLKVQNRDVGVAFELAILYYNDGQKENATKLLEQIVNVDPQNVNARWYLGLIYEETKRTNDAISQYQAILAVLPENVAVKQRLANLQKKISKPANQLAEPLQEQSKTNPIQ
ncbi:MAG TPA: tetratricopeptide repeat protein [Patescibacteria group bacterium]|nr:tetratricopeptide repeat protein [Patescibacteria group bacterium]